MSLDSEVKKDGALRWRRVENFAVILGCDPGVSDCVIPAVLDNLPVVAVEEAAFKDCLGLTSVVIPKSVKRIGNHAFYDCSRLERVELPEGLTSIEGRAFVGCRSLLNLSLPESVVNIGLFAFDKNTLILAKYGSFAERWARENGVTYRIRLLLLDVLNETPGPPSRIDGKTQRFNGNEYIWSSFDQDYVRQVSKCDIEYSLRLSEETDSYSGRRQVVAGLKMLNDFSLQALLQYRVQIIKLLERDVDRLQQRYQTYRDESLIETSFKLNDCVRQFEQAPDDVLQSFFMQFKQDDDQSVVVPPPKPTPPPVPDLLSVVEMVFSQRPTSEHEVRRLILSYNVPLSKLDEYAKEYMFKYGVLIKKEPPKNKLPDPINQALEIVRQKKPKTQTEVKNQFLKLGYDESYALTLTSIFMNRWSLRSENRR